MPKTINETIGDIVIKMIDKGMITKIEDNDLISQNNKNINQICFAIKSLSESIGETIDEKEKLDVAEKIGEARARAKNL